MLLHMVADQVAGMVADMGAGMVADKVADMVVGMAADKKNIIVLAWHIVAHGAWQGGGMVWLCALREGFLASIHTRLHFINTDPVQLLSIILRT